MGTKRGPNFPKSYKKEGLIRKVIWNHISVRTNDLESNHLSQIRLISYFCRLRHPDTTSNQNFILSKNIIYWKDFVSIISKRRPKVQKGDQKGTTFQEKSPLGTNPQKGADLRTLLFVRYPNDCTFRWNNLFLRYLWVNLQIWDKFEWVPFFWGHML